MKRLMIAAAILAAASPTLARDLITCGPQAGKSYYLAGKGIPEKDAGWTDDGVSGSHLTVSVDENDEYEMVDTGGGRPFSYKADGCTLLGAKFPDQVKVVAICPGHSLAVYQFVVSGDGNATLLVTTVKQTPVLNGMSAFTAKCRVLAPLTN